MGAIVPLTKRITIAAWLFLALPLQAQTVQEAMHVASSAQRNEAFQKFLRQHNVNCPVNESAFGANLKVATMRGDIWSIRCTNAQTYAIFIADDRKSTSWFLSCHEVEQRSDFRCFEKGQKRLTIK